MVLLGLGFQQFLTQDSEMTQELVEEGKEHMKRERRRRQRLTDAASLRNQFSEIRKRGSTRDREDILRASKMDATFDGMKLLRNFNFYEPSMT